METDLRHQIRKHVNQYLTRMIGVERFQDLIVPIILATRKKKDSEVQNDLDEIELLLAEYTGSYLSESEFRNQLATAFSCVFLNIAQPSEKSRRGQGPFASKIIGSLASLYRPGPVRVSWSVVGSVVSGRPLGTAS